MRGLNEAVVPHSPPIKLGNPTNEQYQLARRCEAYMVYTGKPSAGCENCRKAKKKCDQGLPACGRCVRLGRACGGYRDLNELMFRDQSSSVARRASGQSDVAASSSSVSTTRQASPDKETVARTYFFEHFVTPSHMEFLEGVTPDAFLLKPILACGLAALANREQDLRGQELARRYYVEAITATNEALRHPRRVKEDYTLIAVSLLAFYERLGWDTNNALQSWRHHVQGASQVLLLRGRAQLRNLNGVKLFRELRGSMLVDALMNETEAPDYVAQWSQALNYDPYYSPGDQLAVLAARIASVKAAFRTADKSDQELVELTRQLEADLLSWSEDTLVDGAVCSFHNVADLDSPHSWNGVRHEYGLPQAYRYWNMWRCLRILVSRIQEALWRRSWPTLEGPQPAPAQYKAIRSCMAADICIAAAYAFGNNSATAPPKGSVSSGYLLIMPLCLAGTCLLETLADPSSSPGGSRMILVDRPLHQDPFNQVSVQLAWVIARVEYIAEKVGIQWAGVVARFLKGQCRVYYDLGRSRVIKEHDLDDALLNEILDLSSIMELCEGDEGGLVTDV